MEAVRRKNINKNDSVYRIYQAQLSDGCNWWFLRRSSIPGLIQDNAGRKRFLTFFKKDPCLDLMIINFENAALHICSEKG